MSLCIPHLVLPSGASPRISKLAAMTKAARVPQFFPGKGTLRDHAPLLLDIDVGAPSLLNSTDAVAWNFNAIELAPQTPGLREGFLSELNGAMQMQEPTFLGFLEADHIDDGRRAPMSVVQPIAKKHFGRARRVPGAALAG
eukprot:9482168-Pyramimonas_sp.AAC.1